MADTDINQIYLIHDGDSGFRWVNTERLLVNGF